VPARGQRRRADAAILRPPAGPQRHAARTHIAFSPPRPNGVVMAVTLYSTAICPYCVAAKNFLKSRGVDYQEVRIDTDPVQRERMLSLARRTSVPQIFVGDAHVGGYEDLVAAARSGRLDELLAQVAP
jgi:glutaredoxin 3